MYLRLVYIENSGPLINLNLVLPFTENDLPKPVLLVGGNGSGKTNLLSIIGDALFEAAAVHYTDVVQGSTVGNRPWFRIIGPATINVGAAGSCALLHFDQSGTTHIYKEKGGTLHAPDVGLRVPDELKAHVSWADEGSIKEFSISDVQSKSLFETGVYLYLPSSRAEAPHWLNRASLPTDDFNLAPRYTKQLRKPIYVERGLDQLKQWMLSLLIEIRMDFQLVVGTNGQTVPLAVGSTSDATAHRSVWDSMNRILRLILNDSSARFVWLGRNASSRLGIQRESLARPIPLEGLSAGQATLLNIFGTLLRYGDGTVVGSAPTPDQLVGLCVVDEIDAHMHIDLQYRALPELIKLFPKVQFVVSSHSPLFVLGMEKTFGADNISITDMPSGTRIQAEAYVEFGRALETLQGTQAFSQAVLDVAAQSGKLIVFVEGETDPVYLSTAMELLSRSDLKDLVEFEWIGAKDPKSGQGFHTGKDALNATANVLRAKPDLVKRPILLLYDNDVNKAAEDHAKLHIRSMPSNRGNSAIESGIENLLPESAVTNDMFDEKTNKKRNGNTTITRSLNKMKLCKHVCEVKRDRTDFIEFAPVLDMITLLVSSGE